MRRIVPVSAILRMTRIAPRQPTGFRGARRAAAARPDLPATLARRCCGGGALLLEAAGMARLERSAGFICFRRQDDAPGGVEYLLLDYGRHWEYAKGHVNQGESDLDAAFSPTASRFPPLMQEFR